MDHHLLDVTNTAWFNAAYLKLVGAANKLHVTAAVGINGVLDSGIKIPESAIVWQGSNKEIAIATFNIARQAVGVLSVTESSDGLTHYLCFTARFLGRTHSIEIPMRCIKGLVRVDDGTTLQTTAYPMFDQTPIKEPITMNVETPKNRPQLRVIKNNKDIPESQRNKDRSHLRVVK